MSNLLKKLRAKKQKEKEFILLVSSLLVTLFVLSVWGALAYFFGEEKSTQDFSFSSLEEDLNLDAIKKNMEDDFVEIIESADSIKNNFKADQISNSE